MPRLAKAGKALAKVRVKKPKPEPHPLEQVIGDLVSYYDEGWRYGYLEAIEKGSIARIRPIAGYKVKAVRRTRTSVENVKLLDGTN